MPGIAFEYRFDDREVAEAFRRLVALGKDPSPLMRDVATLGESTTRERFETETAPDGTRWEPSLRATLTGTRTLTREGHLAASITGLHGRDWAAWGTNRIYGRIHQLGGTIRPKSGDRLRFRLADGGFRSPKQVTMPARPFLGISDTDAADIRDLAERHIARALGT